MNKFQPQPTYGAGGMPAHPTRGSGKATFSLVFGFLSFCFSLFAGVPAVIVGIMALSDIGKSQGQVGGRGVAITGIVLGIVGSVIWIPMACILPALLLPAVQSAREAARDMAASNDLRQISIAVHGYHDRNRSFPIAGDLNADPAAVPAGMQLSWRVHLLPHLGHDGLFQQFHLDEPWDSPHNKTLINQMPSVYRSPASGGQLGKTSYLAIVPGPGCPPNFQTMLMPDRAMTIRETNDGVANTVMLIDAGPGNMVEWTKPGDFKFNYNSPRQGLPIDDMNGLTAVLGDGSIRMIDRTTSDDDIRWLFFANDGNAIGF